MLPRGCCTLLLLLGCAPRANGGGSAGQPTTKLLFHDEEDIAQRAGLTRRLCSTPGWPGWVGSVDSLDGRSVPCTQFVLILIARSNVSLRPQSGGGSGPSISTDAPKGKAATSTVARAGGHEGKYRA